MALMQYILQQRTGKYNSCTNLDLTCKTIDVAFSPLQFYKLENWKINLLFRTDAAFTMRNHTLIHIFLPIWSHLLEKSLVENFMFWGIFVDVLSYTLSKLKWFSVQPFLIPTDNSLITRNISPPSLMYILSFQFYTHTILNADSVESAEFASESD